MKLLQTPSQTVGPFFAYGLIPEQYGYDYRSLAGNILLRSGATTQGSRRKITITGQVFDGDNLPIKDAMIEIWQPGEKTNDSSLGFGRHGTGTDPGGRFTFYTLKPEALNGQAPHLALNIFMRGLLSHLYTRVYFGDEPEKNQEDKVLNSVPQNRQSTLIAKKNSEENPATYLFDLHMQGQHETVFFDL